MSKIEVIKQSFSRFKAFFEEVFKEGLSLPNSWVLITNEYFNGGQDFKLIITSIKKRFYEEVL